MSRYADRAFLFGDARRWQIETAFRFFKSERAQESPPSVVVGESSQTLRHRSAGLCLSTLVGRSLYKDALQFPAQTFLP